MMKEYLLILVIVQVATVTPLPLRVNTTGHGILTLEGRERVGADAYIAGHIRSPEGDGIRFRSTVGSLIVTTMDGRNLISFYSLPLEVRSCGVEVNMQESPVVYQLLEDQYVVANKRTYRYPHEDVSSASSHCRLLARLQYSDLTEPQVSVQVSVDNLIVHPSLRLLEPAAQALGEDLGIIGKNEPAIMAFYTTAMTLTKAYKKEQRAKMSLARKSNPWEIYINRHLINTQKELKCLKTCPPCKDLECFGMCGYGCSCWRWVCDDCCYHEGCRDHDMCCRGETYTFLGCYFPYTFACDAPYEC